MHYVKTFFITALISGVFFHLMTPGRVAWWPDTVSTGAIFGVIAVLIAVKARSDREQNRRLWNGLKTLARRSKANRG